MKACLKIQRMNLSFEGAVYHGFNFRIERMDKKKFMTV